MTIDSDGGLLRFALRLDALACGVLAILALAGAAVLEGLLGTPASLVRPLGLVLLVFAGGVWLVAAQQPIRRWAAWAVVGLNALWVVDSVATVLLGWWALTTLGTLLVLAQAVATALVAELEFMGLRRASV